MKPTREEIKALAYKVGFPNLYLDWPDNFEVFALAMYKRGQEDMREQAAKNAIRALPIEGEKE